MLGILPDDGYGDVTGNVTGDVTGNPSTGDVNQTDRLII